jgi:hypothetical protein
MFIDFLMNLNIFRQKKNHFLFFLNGKGGNIPSSEGKMMRKYLFFSWEMEYIFFNCMDRVEFLILLNC